MQNKTSLNLIFFILFTFTSPLALINHCQAAKLKEITQAEYEKLPKLKYPSLVKTNMYGAMYPASGITTYAADTALYDVSYIVYTSEFAKEHGYPMDEEFIDDTLPKELKAVEFGVKTDGETNRCLMKILIDKSLDIDFPQEELAIRSIRNGDRMRLPKQDWRSEDKQAQKFRIDVMQGDDYRYNMNVAIATGDYDLSRNKGGIGSLVLREFSRKYFKDLNYIKTDIGCTDLTRRRLRDKNPKVWIKKTRGKNYENYQTIVSGRNPKEFYQLSLPKRIINKILPVMEDADKYFRYGGEGVIRMTQ